MAQTDPRLLLLHPDDNVFVLRATVISGEEIEVAGQTVRIGATVGLGHKLARQSISKGEKVLKYGAPIGLASSNIVLGEHVHLTNLQSDYTVTHSLEEARAEHGSGVVDD